MTAPSTAACARNAAFKISGQANSDRKVVVLTAPLWVHGPPQKLSAVKIKVERPRSGGDQTFDADVMASDVSPSDYLDYVEPDVAGPQGPFWQERIRSRSKVSGTYRHDQCVEPVDPDCDPGEANYQQPFPFPSGGVAVGLFRVQLTLGDYEPGTEVSGWLVLCFTDAGDEAPTGADAATTDEPSPREGRSRRRAR